MHTSSDLEIVSAEDIDEVRIALWKHFPGKDI
jgi:hypothetical protein